MEALQQNKTLTSLSLNYCHLIPSEPRDNAIDEVEIELVATLLRTNAGIRDLRIEQDNLGRGLQHFGQALRDNARDQPCLIFHL